MKQTKKNNKQMENEFNLSTSKSSTDTGVFRFNPLLTPTPFSVTFTWSGKSITVQLENGEDVLKLANIFSEFLTNNGITNIIKNE
jgi:hypothetical protein